MPELPEVEVVRRGLARWVTGTTIDDVEVLHPRPVRRHEAGIDDFVSRLSGVTVLDAVRRGKFLWLTLDSGEALLAHLGMSGQLLLEAPDAPDEKHLRVRLGLTGGSGRELRFVDQRMFGGLAVVGMVKTPDGGPGGLGGVPDDEVPTGLPEEPAGEGPVQGEYGAGEALLPQPVAHIARDALDPALDTDLLAARLKRRETGLKRALLDQTLISGIGNIYADEALWRARLHYDRPTDKLNRPTLNRLLADVQNVMREALAQGGTSFDSLYVDVNGQSGYFERGLDAYGREGEACHRCGTQIRRESFMNRSSFFCPKCQPKPRAGRS
ncbi:Fpg/Nei family DNA glycosylase [Kineosporia sp. J2-2]|uniref:Formamidopyrimidine-DNA glycosylase n=1 Tax=Kineosporia corallincola TaxID=2835133 RepID=A0ABS5THB2_9ACTN|nr:Fpg/Nei family DNA glycosylase [Kineosporia corallincola]MBT0769784.1 Fpg/Nei family DNA glycosylase [Kineosporia corallincola]